jgi:hypothetical protein
MPEAVIWYGSGYQLRDNVPEETIGQIMGKDRDRIRPGDQQAQFVACAWDSL